MRKMLRNIMMAMVAISLAGCGTATQPASPSEQPTQTEQPSQATPEPKKVIEIGISQFVQHPALDSVRQGIIDGLAEQGYADGDTINIEYQNAQGDINNTATIAQKFAGNKDMVIAIATPSAQAAAQVITDVPVIFSTVTDPIAAQLVSSLEQPDKNVTGTSDKVSMESQLELIQKFVPELKTLGVIYTTSEVNAEVQVKEIEEAAKNKEIEVITSGISNSSEVQLATQTIVEKVDAILIPIDNTVVSSVEGVLGAAQKANVPVFASDSDTVKRGAVATYGIDYYGMGKQTGEMAARILSGETVAENPVEVSRDTDLIINKQAAEAFGLTISEELLGEAKEVVE